MAEDAAAKRRDARRRRILQSPEERMKKIAGVASDASTDPDEVDGNDWVHTGPVTTEMCNDPNNELEVEPTNENIPCPHRIIEQQAEKKLLQEMMLTNTKDEGNQDTTKGGHNPDEQIKEAQKEEVENDNEKIRWLISARNTMLSIGLGVLLRVILWFDIAALNTQSVVGEFLIMHAIWMKCNPWEDPDAPSRPIPLPGLITTLLLAGVQNPALAVISKIINTITQFLTNFALFLFTFICTHCLLEIVT